MAAQPTSPTSTSAPKAGQPPEVNIILEGKPLRDHNLDALRSIIASATRPVQVFVSPSYFLSGNEAAAAQLVRFIEEHKSQIAVGVHLSAQRSLVEASGVRFRLGPTFWGYTLDSANCHALCGIEVPLLGYTPNEQNAIIKTAVQSLNENLGQKIRHSLIEGGYFTKSLAGRLLSHGITTDHTLSGKSPEDYYELRHYPLYGWLQKTGTLQRLARRAGYPRCVLNLINAHADGGCMLEGHQHHAAVHVYHGEAFLQSDSGTQLLLSH